MIATNGNLRFPEAVKSVETPKGYKDQLVKDYLNLVDPPENRRAVLAERVKRYSIQTLHWAIETQRRIVRQK